MTATDAIKDFPAGPEGSAGWPWEFTGADRGGDIAADSGPWPRITIVTPSYNQGRFLEATIRSVLLQGYPNLEYIVVDGGSTDDSVEVIRRYQPWIDYWVSEPDRGQAHAINKGFERATGEIFAWLNSDDMYTPEALWRIGEAFRRGDCDVTSGHAVFVDENGVPEGRYPAAAVDVRRLLSVRGGFTAPQQGTFWSRQCWERNGPLSEDLHYLMDYDFWIRMAAAGEKWIVLDRDLAFFRHHGSQKTAGLSSNLQMLGERRQVLERFRATGLCTRTFFRAVTRGLRENRVKEIRVTYANNAVKIPFWIYWLQAGLKNPICLSIPAFYGLLFRAGSVNYGPKTQNTD